MVLTNQGQHSNEKDGVQVRVLPSKGTAQSQGDGVP
jgi:hypothetical protein